MGRPIRFSHLNQIPAGLALIIWSHSLLMTRKIICLVLFIGSGSLFWQAATQASTSEDQCIQRCRNKEEKCLRGPIEPRYCQGSFNLCIDQCQGAGGPPPWWP